MSDTWHVALLSPPYAVLTYERPSVFPDPFPGQRVLVPLGGGTRVGVVVGPDGAPPQGVTLRPMLWPVDADEVLDEHYLELARNLATRQMAPVGRILELLLPRGLRAASLTYHLDAAGFPARMAPRQVAALSERERGALLRAWEAGRVRTRVNLKAEARDNYVNLACDPPWPVRPNAKRQIELLDHLYDNGPQSLAALTACLGSESGATAKRLASAGVVTIGPPAADELAEPPSDCEAVPLPATPSAAQERAIAAITARIDGGKGASCLLHGVTGSGKTFVYLRAIRHCLDQGRSAILLAPEVALACQLWQSVREALGGESIHFSHGYQSPRLREDTFLGVGRSKRPVVVVGTRSALFLPMRDLGLIILDEEHDESYKQEERLAYQAKEVAHFRAERQKAVLVLGSATPDVKTYHAAVLGKVPLLELPSRVGQGTLPEIELVDVTGKTGREDPLAPETMERIRAAVDAGDQVIVMLNRRGYAPIMYCADCEAPVRCPHCHVGMTYHKRRGRLICHYCGHQLSFPLVCADCGGTAHIPMGEGTERIEEALRAALPPETGITRLDRDSARRQERLECILDDFRTSKNQVMVGTQMLSKGHHFPGVTLVVVADGDLGLSLPDYRAAERTFQLLVQVAGRAGRGERPGAVLIQTRNPAHFFWDHVIRGDYATFFASEVQRREKFRYPPFVRLGLIRISHPEDWEQGGAAVERLGERLRELGMSLGAVVLGPAPAPLGRLRNRLRYNCLVKSPDWQAIRSLYAGAAQANPTPLKLRMELDLDPLNML